MKRVYDSAAVSAFLNAFGHVVPRHANASGAPPPSRTWNERALGEPIDIKDIKRRRKALSRDNANFRGHSREHALNNGLHHSKPAQLQPGGY